MANVPISNMTATWTDSGTTYTAVKMNVTDTASNAASLLMDLQINGSSSFRITKSDPVLIGPVLIGAGNSGRISYSSLAGAITFGTASNAVRCGYVNTSAGLAERLSLASDLPIGFTATTSALGAIDTTLFRDNAANTLAQRNATNAQTFNIYNTYSTTTNYERGFLKWNTNVLQIGTEKGSGGGTARALEFQTDGTTRLTISAAGTVSVGNLSIAQSGINFSDWNGVFGFSGGTQFRQNSTNEAPRIVFGGTEILEFGGGTSSFPGLKRNGAMLETRLADDSAFAALGAEWLSITDGITAPGAATGRARIYVDTADGDLKVVFADGTVKTIVTDT